MRIKLNCKKVLISTLNTLDCTSKVTTLALHSLKIREAINIGFDRDKMITYLRNTIGFAAEEGFIPLGLQGRSTLKKIIISLKKRENWYRNLC